MIPYARFYRAFGIRRPEFLLAPPLPTINKLNFPFFSVYHYFGTGVGDLGPSQSDPMIAAQPSLSVIEHIDHLSELEGNPRRLPVALTMLIRKHRTLNNRFVPLKRLDTVARNQRTLIAFNYSLIDTAYRYPRNRLAIKFKNENKLSTVIDKVNQISKEISHQHYLMVDLPEFLPSISELRMAMRVTSPQVLQRFSDFDTFFLYQLWLWLGRDRSLSMFSKLSDEAARLTNIVFRDAGRFSVLNLGQVDSWRKLEREELQEVEDEDFKNGMKDKVTIQKSFLMMMVNMTSARSEIVPENIEDVDSPTEAEFDASAVSEDKDVSDTTQQEEQSEAPEDKNQIDSDEIDRALTSLDMIGTQMPVMDEDPDVSDIVDEHDASPEIKPLKIGKISQFSVQTPMRLKATQEDLDLPPYASNFMEVLNEVADSGALGAAEYRRLSEQSKSYLQIKAPDGSKLGDFIDVKPQDTEIKTIAKVPDIGNVFDKSMLESTLLDFTNNYVEKYLQRDVGSMVVSLQNSGVLIKDYEVQEINTVLGSYYSYSVGVKPIQGQPSVFHFRIPKVNEEGQFVVNGTKYFMRMQRGDLPIRKIHAGRVALTSYYGKVFVDRCSRKVHNYGRWICDQIRSMGIDDTNPLVSNMIPGHVYHNDSKLPRLYTTLSMEFVEFTVLNDRDDLGGSYRLYFDYNKRLETFGLGEDNSLEKDGSVVCGTHSDGSIVVMKDDLFFKSSFDSQSKTYSLTPIADLTYLLHLEDKNVPLDFAEVLVFGQPVPVGVVLAYYSGLSRLVKSLGIEPRIVPTGKRVHLQPHEWAMYFEDETWVFNRKDRMASMVLGGWRDYIKASINYPVHEFDKKDVYLNLLESKQLGARYIREIDLLKQMFIDPITNRLLVKLEEPTTWVGLLTRSCELLLTDEHPSEIDTAYMRIKGYERLAGAVYGELVRGLRVHNARGNKARHKLEHNPYAVWMAIAQDPSKEQVCETNPIQDLKEREAVTYSGTGGRSARTMSKRTRIYHRNEMGTISESTVDSSDVGVNVFTSANPQFNCLEGISNPYEKGKTGNSSLLSTSALVSPASDQDDPKRTLMVAIQHRHTVGCKSYRQNPVRTGYEQVVPHRVSSTYAVTAKKPGNVVSSSADGIIVKFDDGEEKGYQVGTSFGKASGLIIPHRLITPLKAGDRFEIGQAITYNPEFFEPDMINPKQIVWKSGITITTALLESTDTLEDSSAVSESVSDLLKTTVTNIRPIVVSFDNAVFRMVREGDNLETSDILCIIEDATGGSSRMLDEETINTLQALSSQTPTAKNKGFVARVEVFYHGDKADMSPSLRELADASDRALAKRCKAQGQKVFTGSVDSDYRVNNEPLFLDQAVINVYITSEVKVGVGDKGVFGNQLKTVFGRVFSDNCKTQSGVKVDAIFGAKSVDDRIVDSPIFIGTTAALLEVIAKKVIEAYES